ncbi:hypothetical protein QE152_g25378 [Popillia japonica]|uniref:Reverse transcriptase n=1 Tax=Popillia japonica TaxID=7064 RepID=A0AAW1K067_POPJA
MHNLISLRKTLKQKINQTLSIDEKTRITKEYSKIHKNIKKSARTDKRKWIDGIATAAEEAAATQNLKELYKSTKLLSSTNFSKNQPIRSKNGELITTTEEQLIRWEQCELLQQNPNFSEAESEQHDRDTKYLEIDHDIHTENEIAEAINKLRNGKAPGIDGIPSELWKVHTKASSQILFHRWNTVGTVEGPHQSLISDFTTTLRIDLEKRGNAQRMEYGVNNQNTKKRGHQRV